MNESVLSKSTCLGTFFGLFSDKFTFLQTFPYFISIYILTICYQIAISKYVHYCKSSIYKKHNVMIQDDKKYGIVFVTASSQTEAETIAEALVQSHLAACVSITPIRSIYTWKGEVHRDQEWQLIIKTELTQFDQIAAKVHQLHSYEVPEVFAVPIVQGSDSYLRWITEQVS